MYKLQKWLQSEEYAFSKAKKIGRAYYMAESNLIAFLEHEQR